MLNELSQAERFSCAAEPFLEAIVDCDSRLGMVSSVEIPSQETREVLDGTEELVAADCSACLETALVGWKLRDSHAVLVLLTGSGYKAVEMSDMRMIDERGSGDHDGGGVAVRP